MLSESTPGIPASTSASQSEKVIFERDYEDESFPTDAKDFSFAKLGFLTI